MVVRESLFTGIVVKLSGILCRLGWAFTSTSSVAAFTTLGDDTLSGWIILGVAGMGTPVFRVSPLLKMMGCMVSPVTGFMA